jgi:hypothetical protein
METLSFDRKPGLLSRTSLRGDRQSKKIFFQVGPGSIHRGNTEKRMIENSYEHQSTGGVIKDSKDKSIPSERVVHTKMSLNCNLCEKWSKWPSKYFPENAKCPFTRYLHKICIYAPKLSTNSNFHDISFISCVENIISFKWEKLHQISILRKRLIPRGNVSKLIETVIEGQFCFTFANNFVAKTKIRC